MDSQPPALPDDIDALRAVAAAALARNADDAATIAAQILAGAAAVAMFRGRCKLGIDHFRVHDLRRTAATRMAELGIRARRRAARTLPVQQ
jgi:integrase